MATVLAVFLWAGFLLPGFSPALAQESEAHIQHDGAPEYVTGVVREIRAVPEAEFRERHPGYQPLTPDETIQKVRVELTGGAYAGETITVENYVTGQKGYNIPLEPGARIILQMEHWPDEPEPDFHIVDRERSPVLLLVAGLFLLFLLVSGGKSGLKSLLLGGGTILLLRAVLFPAVFSGVPVFLGTLILVLALLLGGVYLFWGTDRLGQAVFWGTLDSVAAGGLVVVIASVLAPLRGFVSEGMIYFQIAYPMIPPLEIYYAGWLLMAGAVAFHLAHSLVVSIRLLPEKPAFSELMTLGNRHLGGLHLALILLALGGFLPSFFQWQQEDLYRLLNLESVVSYAVWFLALLTTAVLTVPFTARAALRLLEKDSA